MVEPPRGVPEPTKPPPDDPEMGKVQKATELEQALDERPGEVVTVQPDGSVEGQTFPDKPPSAIVLHSGGIDSTTCLYLAMRDFGRENVVSLSMFYGQRHDKEIICADDICRRVGVEHHIVRTVEFPMSMLTNPDAQVPSVSYKDLGPGVSPTYVPFRNGNLLSHVAAIAQARGASAIYFGAHAEDAHNWAYPDCSPEFIGAMANAIYIGTYHQVRLITPLEWISKDEIITLGCTLGVPWELTWSCYKGEPIHCGTCPTCRARRTGFRRAGKPDPTEYKMNPL